MRAGLVASILAVLLVGGAFWYRFSPKSLTGGLSVTDSPPGINNYVPSNIDAVTADGSGNKTTLLGQQLLSDFISLSANGRGSGSDINNLADQYVNSIPNLVKSPTISKSDLNVVGNSKTEIAAYNDALTKVLTQYESDMKKSAPQTNTIDAKFYAAARNMATVYSSTVTKLKEMPVPAILADLHTKLINIYLADASAMTAIANTDTDAAKSFAGLVNIQNSLDEERTVLNQINAQLSKL